MAIWITYKADRDRAAHLLLDAARCHANDSNAIATKDKDDMQARFGVNPIDLDPRVLYSMTNN